MFCFEEFNFFQAILVASIAHDLCHPGVNNAFMTGTLSDLAILYNDTVSSNFMFSLR